MSSASGRRQSRRERTVRAVLGREWVVDAPGLYHHLEPTGSAIERRGVRPGRRATDTARAKQATTAQRLALLVAVAGFFTLLDLYSKAVVSTPEWADHPRQTGWWISSLVVAIGAITAVWVPAGSAAVAAGVMIGGLLGNLISDASHGSVPNPFSVQVGGYTVVFNLADVLIGAGFIALAGLLAWFTLRQQGLHRAPAR